MKKQKWGDDEECGTAPPALQQGAMGYRGMEHIVNEAHRGYGVQGYGPHGQ